VAIADAAARHPPPAPWQHRLSAHRDRNARMTTRWHKLHPHVLFPQHDLSLYIDGNVYLKQEVRPLIERMSALAKIALFRHPERGCPYEEAAVVKRYRLDDPAIVDTQMSYYRRLGYPANRGLYAASIQIRRHNDPDLVAFLEDWWRHLKAFSQRDQLSLNFMLLRHRIEAAVIPGTLAENPWFATAPHRRHRVDLARASTLDTMDEIDWLRMILIDAAERRIAQRDASALARSLSWRVMELMRRAKRKLRWLAWQVPQLDKSGGEGPGTP
jgi:hypothetical protein